MSGPSGASDARSSRGPAGSGLAGSGLAGSGLAGKIVVVTGSTRGIGRAIAEECARRGATVVVSSRTPDAVARAIDEIAALAVQSGDARAGGKGAGAVSGLPADVSRYDDVCALRDHALSAHGRIDVWVSNAGVSNGYRPLDEEGADELERLVAINLLGHMYAAKAVIPYFRGHGGYLMNMCGRGWKGERTPYTAAYASSKAAIASLTKSLAAENKDRGNISVNAFVPGMVDTDFYVDMKTSPRLEATKGNVRLALEAFGTPLPQVGARCADLLEAEPGATTGRIYALLRTGHLITGGAKMAWWGMTGRMARG